MVARARPMGLVMTAGVVRLMTGRAGEWTYRAPTALLANRTLWKIKNRMTKVMQFMNR
jgi:hypothetical protein